MADDMIFASQHWNDGYFARYRQEPNRVYWVNDNAGEGGGSVPGPTPPQGHRHYLANTGFPATMKGSDQNPAQFISAASAELGIAASWIPIGGASMTRTGTGAPPPVQYGGQGTGLLTLSGSTGDLLSLVGKFVGGLGTLPPKPDLLVGDDAGNFQNVFKYAAALAAHARRDEIIRLIADGISFALGVTGASQLNIADISELVGEGLAVFATLPPTPPDADTAAAANDDNFSNLFDYLENEAAYWKRDEQVRAFGSAAKFILERRGIAA